MAIESLYMYLKERNPFLIIFFIVLLSSSWNSLFYRLSKIGLNRFQQENKNPYRISSALLTLIEKFGYWRIIILCWVPIPGAKKFALIAGQLFKLKYTLLIVIIINNIQLIAAFLLLSALL